MKTNNSGMTSLEIIAYAIVGIACLCLMSGVFMETKGVVNDNNSVQER